VRRTDAIGPLERIAGLQAVLHRHPQVEGVLCGHLHRQIVRRSNTTVAVRLPSTTHQIVLDLRSRTPRASE
jgi:3',5'-cyclic-AMP phosphodiesterase